MNEKKLKQAFLAGVVLFALIMVLSLCFSAQEEGSAHVVISEILASNRTYPAPNGEYLDYIEVRNLSGAATDISGYMLADSYDSIGYTFPQGTVLSANGYLVVWCDKNDETGKYASFGISKDGADTVTLYNSANVRVDEVAVGRTETNVPLIRREDGSWAAGAMATPGYENTQAGYEAWLKSVGAGDLEVVISEVMTGSACAAIDGSGQVCDWIELYNPGKKAVVLDGTYLSDDAVERIKWQIPELTLQAGQRVVIRCVGDTAAAGEANFAMPRDGCTVTLTGTMGNVISQVEVPLLNRDHSWALQPDGTYLQTDLISPGAENDGAGYEAWLNAIGAKESPVVISEVMTDNMSFGTNAAGMLGDWVELYNPGVDPVDLSGMYLSDDPADRSKWQIPELILHSGERKVIFCSGKAAADGEAGFALSADGCTVVLTGVMGNVITKTEVPVLGDDRSWALQADGTYLETELATPGYENTEEGYQAYRTSRAAAGPLMISEVMPSNAGYLRQSDGKYYDWVELQNISDSPIHLADYALSRDKDNLGRFQLPDQTLQPGERIVIICSGNTELAGKYVHAPFTLSREESWLYLSSKGELVDYLRVYDVPYQASVGRAEGKAGTYYFTSPTPGTVNGTGVAFICATPTVMTQPGVYNDVSSVSVELSGEGELRYTLDGSMPTSRSALYTQPLELTATTVVRVAGFAEGKLRSDVVTASYIINEYHTLPVVSLAAESGDFFGMYVNYEVDREIRCNVSLYEEGSSFSIDCGIEMYGHMGLKDPKKSFKVNFRGQYGASSLNYPVHGEDGPAVYESLVIRAGQDYPLAIFRDELFTSLARDIGDNLVVQRQKHCILYVNGNYYGIYCIKEAFSEAMYAENHGVSKESVTLAQAPVGVGSEMYKVIRYCFDNDLSQQEHYDYVASQVDIDSLIDWIIMEGYCTNSDIAQNLRYVRSSEDGNKWRFCFYDVDWSWHFTDGFYKLLSLKNTEQHMALSRRMMANREFREKFLQRIGELYQTTLSDENVLQRIEHYHELLAPEVERERDRWGGSYKAWENNVQKLRDFLENNWDNLIGYLREYIGLTRDEEAKYFGR